MFGLCWPRIFWVQFLACLVFLTPCLYKKCLILILEIQNKDKKIISVSYLSGAKWTFYDRYTPSHEQNGHISKI